MIEQVVDRLCTAHPDLPHDDVTRAVDSAYERFTGSRVREFIPLLVERRARGDLSRNASELVWSS
ncbi:hypothetical protein BayCH28_03940 [Mycolicibacterium sp. CH28]|uniref:three-helix bundle dimerization domain-containing protein n=1 Tax=Mycolicibacterium sp. CH28 TaxID=2512237 RepID=UPI001081EE54|nr:hypothetical protein BayCH28_03940 [Mycolicibacterium sp. CH28]